MAADPVETGTHTPLNYPRAWLWLDRLQHVAIGVLLGLILAGWLE